MTTRRLTPRTSLSNPHEAQPVKPSNARMLLGKRITLIDDSVSYTHEDLDRLLSQFNLTWTLRAIAELRPQLEAHPLNAQLAAALDYVAMVSIEVTDDTKPSAPTVAAIERACRIALAFQVQWDTSDGLGFWLRSAFAQAPQQRIMFPLARSKRLLDLWSSVPHASGFAPTDALIQIFGMPYENLLLCCFLFFKSAQRGYLTQADALDEAAILVGLDPAQVQRFLDGLTVSYDRFRAETKRLSKQRTYFRLNPIHRWPLVASDVPPAGATGIVKLVPSPDSFLKRLTTNLLYDLEAHYGSRSADFRTAAGHVFQAYVGQLLRNSNHGHEVLAEQRYRNRTGNDVDTPDWLVVNDDSLVVIETKLNALPISSKLSGNLTAEALQKSIVRGCKQLHAFRRDLQEGTVVLHGIRGDVPLELLLVTYDDVPGVNFAVTGSLPPELTHLAESVTICSVYELERILTNHELPLDVVLRRKRASTEYAQADLGDWCTFCFPAGRPHPYLESAYDALTTGWNAASGGRIRPAS